MAVCSAAPRRRNRHDGADWTRNIDGLTGDLAAIETRAGGVTTIRLQLTDLHGDVIAITPHDTATLTETLSASEFGTPRPATGRRYSWLGAKQRAADTPAGMVLMGARVYNPITGRFLQTDPVPGGSDHAYDYAGHDPLNTFDLDGRLKCGWCKKAAKIVAAAAVFVAIVTCAICATAYAAYSAVCMVNNLRKREYQAAAWDFAGVVTWGYGRKAKAGYEAASAGVKAARNTLRGARGRKQMLKRAQALRRAQAVAERASRRHYTIWHADYAQGAVGFARQVRDL